jgi:predicted porin
MQKKLIALAITAAFASAPAFADTAAYGLVDAGFGGVTNTATTTAGVSSKTGQSGIAFSQNQTSRVGIKSSEDLGNGMKAIYQLEMGLSSNPASDAQFGKTTIGGTSAGFSTNSAIGVDRILTAGLDFGQGTSLTIGKMGSPLRSIVYGNDAMYGANLVGNLVTMDSSLTSRVIAADLAQNFGAVTATVGLLDNTTTADGTPDVKHGNGFEATAVYKQDALSVSGGYRSTKDNSALATNEITTKDMILAANFDFGVAKLYGQFAQVKADQQVGASDKKTYETVGVNMPFTSTLAGYVELGTGKHDTGNDSPKYSAFAVGAKYDLSKSTWVYAHVGSAKSDQTTLTAGSKVDQYAIGLLHSF